MPTRGISRAELIRALQSQPNVTTGAASRTAASLTQPRQQTALRPQPTAGSVMRNQRLIEILSNPIETPRTQPGQIAPVDATMAAALANIGTSIWKARRQKKADAESQELLARELAMMRGDENPVGVEGRGVLLPEAFDKRTKERQAEHDAAALLDPMTQGLAAQRLQPATTEQFTLAPGQIRFAGTGQEIARGLPVEDAAKQGDPTKVAEYNFAKANGYTKSFDEYLREFYGREQNQPSALLEWQAFNQLSPEDQARYIEMKRSMPVTEVGGVPSKIGLGTDVRPLATLEEEAAGRAEVRGAETRASEEAKVGTEARADLPRIEQNATQIEGVITQLLDHPGFDGLFGASSMFRPHLVLGSKWADANALLNQIKGKTFLEAFQTLKGGGQITELEGIKAEQAIARLDTAQSEAAARKALEELREIARIGVQRARERARVGANQAAPQPQRVSMDDPESFYD